MGLAPSPSSEAFFNRTLLLWSTNSIINYLKPLGLKLKADHKQKAR
jgi:hypothetical protein